MSYSPPSGAPGTLGFAFSIPAIIGTVTSVAGVVDQVGDWVGGGGDYPKPLPPPMPFSDAQIADMLTLMPDLRGAIVEQIRRVWKYLPQRLGRPATEADMRNVQTLARLAHWLGDGWEGDTLNEVEETIRVLIFAGMEELKVIAAQEERAAAAVQPPIPGMQMQPPSTTAAAQGAPGEFPWGGVLLALGIGAGALVIGRTGRRR